MDIVAVKDSEFREICNQAIMSGKDMEVVSSVTKLLYPTIAKH